MTVLQECLVVYEAQVLGRRVSTVTDGLNAVLWLWRTDEGRAVRKRVVAARALAC